MPLSKRELEKLRQQLPTKLRREIAKQFNLKPRSLTNILGGHSQNDAVIVAAVAKAKEHAELMESTKKTIAAL